MKRSVPKRLGLLLGALLLLWATRGAALSYYEPSPQGVIGLSQPTIAQKLELGPGERITVAEMWIDGKAVYPSWDETGRVYYTPPVPLSPGAHHVKLLVRVAPERPGFFYAPVESEFRFTVDEGAVAVLPKPGPEQLRALERVNRYRKAAGLEPLAYEERLAAAAAGHGTYLAANPDQVAVDGHRQEPGTPHFIGEAVGDRARYFAYDGGSFEVINFVDRAEEAIDGWMETLYHRIPLIHPGMSVMGYGVAGERGANVNVLLTGPFGAEKGMVRWPHAGQTGVVPMWDGLESPDPFDLYPGTAKPVGYPITLTFGGRPRSLRLTAWSLTGPGGEEPVLRFDPVNDPRLDDTVALIPVAPLRAGASYTVQMRGQVDLGEGTQPFDETWSFTTAPEYRPILRSRTATLTHELRSIRVEGIGFGKGIQVFLGGLPVEGLETQSEYRIAFRPPAGYRGEEADLLVVTPAGAEESWRSFFSGKEGYVLPEATAFTPLPLIVTGKPLAQPALLHRSGALLLPEEALTALGGTPQRIAAIGRTYWQVGERVGDYTLGRLTAGVGGKELRLPLPVQHRQGSAYVAAQFLEELAQVEHQMVDGTLFVGHRILGMIDVEEHWGLPGIRRLLEAKIVGGYGDGSFRPDGTLSRAAFVKMLAAAHGLEVRPGDGAGFSDSGSHWVSDQGYLGAAAEAGIIRLDEYPGRRFEPDRAITREEMAVMLTRALGLEQEALARAIPVEGGAATLGSRTFSDAGAWARPGHVAVAVEAGLITGYPEADGRFTFRPDRSASRAEAAVMLVRALDR